MRFATILCAVVLTAAAADDDAVSFVQRAPQLQTPTTPGRLLEQRHQPREEPAYPMTWHENSMKDLQYNNLGGLGPGDKSAPWEMRFRNVSFLHTGGATGDMALDLRITCVDDKYWSHAKISEQGLSGEFGALYTRKNRAQRFLVELVYTGTTTVAKVKIFDFTIFDIDDAPNSACTTTVAMWGSYGNYHLPDSFHDFSVTGHQYWRNHTTAEVICSNVFVKEGSITNPTSVKTVSHQQARAAIMFNFTQTGSFEFGLHSTKLRQIFFVGSDNPLTWEGILWHEVFEPITHPEFIPGIGQIFQWHLDQEATVKYNNLGGRGPNFDDPHQIRYSNVGTLITHSNHSDVLNGSNTSVIIKEEKVDLVVIIEEQYWGSEFINANWNGANGEFGEIGLSRRSQGTFVFTFVYHNDNRSAPDIPAVSPFHDFIIFDIDNMANPAEGEEYVVYGAREYWLDNHTYVNVVNDSLPGSIHLKSNVTILNGAIPNPTSWANLTDDQLRVAAQFRYYNTATWRVHFVTTATTQRAFLFNGRSSPPLPEVATPRPIDTAAPTAFPTMYPTDAPTVSPTESPTESPTTASPTGSPTESPTESPTTASPTGSPTESPTTPSPTPSPTNVPTRGRGRRTPSPTTLGGFFQPTMYPTEAPTLSTPTAYGDPHVRNLDGEAFDINRASSHTFLLVPRGAAEATAELFVRGTVTRRGSNCSGQLYLTRFFISGKWLGSAGSVELSTAGEGFNVPEAVGLKVGGKGNLSIEEFRRLMPRKMVNVTQLHPVEPAELNKHVTTLLLRMYLGPTILRLSWEHQKEKDGYSNSLMLLTYGLGNVTGEVGGLLGKDDHKWASSSPDSCTESSDQPKLIARKYSCCVRAQVMPGNP